MIFNSSVDANWPGLAEDLFIVAHPYALPAGFVPKASHQVRLWSSLEAAAVIYAPARYVWLDSSLQLYGAVIGRQVYVDSSVKVHYDEALSAIGMGGGAKSERTYWIERSSRVGR